MHSMPAKSSRSSARSSNRTHTAASVPKTTKVNGAAAKAATANGRITGTSKVGGATPQRTTRRPAQARSDKGVSGQPSWGPERRTQFLIDHVGGVTKLAEALDVSKSQPSRWKDGKEIPSPEMSARLLDLDYVVAFAMQTWDSSVVMDWLSSPNGFLDGAPPLEVLRQRGSAEVIDALRATISGAYA